MTLYVVTPDPENGRGGISSVVRAFLQEKELSKHCSVVISHSELGKWKKFSQAKSALKQARKGDAAWFHCGPWLSMLRKKLLSFGLKRKGVKLFFHLHSPTLENYLNSRVGRLLIRWYLAPADKVIVVSSYWQELLALRVPEVESKIIVISNPVDPEFFSGLRNSKAETRKNKNVINILTLARLVKEKHVDIVVDALRYLPEQYQLIIAGDGPELDSLETKVESMKLTERVTFLGWVNLEQKITLMLSADVFCLPSAYDSFGVSFIEAMAAGLPVVAYRQPAVERVVPHEKAGILCDQLSGEKVALALQKCQRERYIYQSFGKTYVTENYKSAELAKQMIRLYSNDVLNSQ